jgi:hypothetical protein
MHRLTARLLLTLMQLGVFTPVALAISAPAPHACCMRKPMHQHGSTSAELHTTAACCNHDCCHALTVSQSPCLTPAGAGQIATIATSLRVESSPVKGGRLIQSPHSGRAPPQFSIT